MMVRMMNGMGGMMWGMGLLWLLPFRPSSAAQAAAGCGTGPEPPRDADNPTVETTLASPDSCSATARGYADGTLELRLPG